MKYKGINVEKIKEIQRVKLPNADAFKKFSPEDIENICSNTDSFDAVCNQIKKELEARKNDIEMAIICEMALNYLQSMKDKEVANKEAYDKGLNDAWELAKKLVLPDKDVGMKISEIENVFKINFVDVNDILRNFTPQEALAKLEAYEKEQNEIKVGDVVEVNGYKFLVTTVANDHIDLIDSKGITTSTTSTCKKTGRHIDIQKILEQIAGD